MGKLHKDIKWYRRPGIDARRGPKGNTYGFTGKKNVFLENTDAAVPVGEIKRRMENKGGHRFWHTPENCPRNYVPDDDPIEWVEIENGVG